MTSLSLSLLGTFQASFDGKHVESFRTNKVQALLIYLAIERTDSHRREHLMTLLWPGMPEKSGRHNLRQVLYQLSQEFPSMGIPPENPPRAKETSTMTNGQSKNGRFM